MNEYLPYIAILISALGLLISFRVFKNKEQESENQKCKEQFDLINQSNVKLAQCYLKLEQHCHDNQIQIEVLKERINNENNLLDKLEEKLDKLMEQL